MKRGSSGFIVVICCLMLDTVDGDKERYRRDDTTLSYSQREIATRDDATFKAFIEFINNVEDLG